MMRLRSLQTTNKLYIREGKLLYYEMKWFAFGFGNRHFRLYFEKISELCDRDFLRMQFSKQNEKKQC